MIMRDGELAIIMQQQEEDEAQKLMEKEQQAISSNPTGKALLLIQSYLSLLPFFSVINTPSSGVWKTEENCARKGHAE